jgi:hypothetical protein
MLEELDRNDGFTRHTFLLLRINLQVLAGRWINFALVPHVQHSTLWKNIVCEPFKWIIRLARFQRLFVKRVSYLTSKFEVSLTRKTNDRMLADDYRKLHNNKHSRALWKHRSRNSGVWTVSFEFSLLAHSVAMCFASIFSSCCLAIMTLFSARHICFCSI